MKAEKEVVDEIKRKAKEEYPADKEMQKYYVDEELDYYSKIIDMDFTGAESIKEAVMKTALENAKILFNCWEDVFGYIEEEKEAFNYIKIYKHPLIPQSILDEMKKESIKFDSGCISEQKDELDRLTSKYLHDIWIKDEVLPVKDLLIELESIIGNDCFNTHAQSGLARGRTIRYPITFPDGEDEVARSRKVDSTIDAELLMQGYYKFGANELNIFRALMKVISHLKNKCDLVLPKLTKPTQRYKNQNYHLHKEFVEYIDDVEVRDAYHVLVGAAVSLEKFNSYPEQKGVINDFRYYIEDNIQPFAFIINKNSLLFYLRQPAIASGKYTLESLLDSLGEVNENNAGEWTISIHNRDEAISIIEKILLAW